nr:hypothetical protein [Stenotrophomonas maltophilia]
MGITVVAFARQNNLDRHAVNDALRGVGKGNFGKSHEAAVALGIKRDLDRPAFRRHSDAIIDGNDRGVYGQQQAVHG